jgi:hypothetical protein
MRERGTQEGQRKRYNNRRIGQGDALTSFGNGRRTQSWNVDSFWNLVTAKKPPEGSQFC